MGILGCWSLGRRGGGGEREVGSRKKSEILPRCSL